MATEFERLQRKYESVAALVGALEDAAERCRALDAAEPDDHDAFAPYRRSIEATLNGTPDAPGLLEMAADLEIARDDAEARLHEEATLEWTTEGSGAEGGPATIRMRADSLHDARRAARNLVDGGAAPEVLITRGGVQIGRVWRDGEDVLEWQPPR